MQAGGAGSGASAGSSAAALSLGAQAEISYLNGLTSSGTIAATSFWTWNYNTPATYSSTSYAAKWGSSTPGTTGGTVTYWFDAASAWTATEMAALQSGLALWSALANINFALATSAATANFIFYENNSGSAYENGPIFTTTVGSSSTGSHTSTGAVISIDTDVAGFGPIGGSFGTYGGYPYQTLLHEIGHLIGLGHGGGYNGNVNVATQQFSAYDTRLWTIMSYINPWTTGAKYYSSYPVTGTNWGISADGYYNVPTTPMILDIAAVQQLYGLPTSGPLIGGGKIFGFNSNLATSIKSYFDFTVNTNPVITLWASGTNNTLDLSGWSNPATINLNPGTFSSAHGQVNNIGIADGAVIDKAIGGGGSDSITGSSLNNTLTGKGGSDTINGADGSDTAVYSGAKSQYQITKNADGSIRLVDLRSGSPDGTDTVSNVEFFQFADGTVTAASLFNAAPVVTVPNATVNAGSTAAIAMSSLVSATDADGDTLAYLFYDSTVGGGRFYLNGVAQPEGSGVFFAVGAAQLSQLTFVPGAGSSDDLSIGATDGKIFSGWSSLHINGPINHAPAVTIPNATVNASSTAAIAISGLFSANDSDGNPLTYTFKDNSTGGGHFYLNGVLQADGATFSVTAAQLSQVTYVPVAGSSDDLQIQVSDGTLSSGWANLHINGPINHAPVLSVPNATVNAGSMAAIPLSSLVSATDSDGDSLAYIFYDSAVGGGRFYLNGLAQPEAVIFGVGAAQLSQLTFVPGAGSSDDLLVGVSDGKVFSGWSNLHINGPINHAPTVTVPNGTVNASSTAAIAISGLFSANDSDGNPLTYSFKDNSTGGGHFYLNGVLQADGQSFSVSAAQLSQVTYAPGAGSSDDLQIQASDGTLSSGWANLHINGPINHPAVLSVPNTNVTASNGQTLQFGSLVSASDSDGDTLAFIFYDSTVGGGHIYVNGVAQPEGNGQLFGVSASMLSQTTFVAGASGDDILIGVTDGKSFTGWTTLHVGPPVNHAPIVYVSNQTWAGGASVPATKLFLVSDVDGNAMTAYQFMDSTSGSASGYFMVNGVAQAASQAINVTPAQLSQTTFVAGHSAIDQLMVRAFDGTTWSDWKQFDLTSLA